MARAPVGAHGIDRVESDWPGLATRVRHCGMNPAISLGATDQSTSNPGVDDQHDPARRFAWVRPEGHVRTAPNGTLPALTEIIR